MAVNMHTGEHVYYNEYEIKDFYIRFPHYEKNQLFMPVIRYVLDGREVYQRMYMPLYDWQRLFDAEGVDLKAISESKNQEHHFVKTVLINHGGCFFESFEGEDEDDEEIQRMRLDGGGEFDGVEADWFVFKSLLNADNDLTSEISELVDKADETIGDVIYLSDEKDNVTVKIAMCYDTDFSTEIRTYINNFASRRGGSHCEGFLAGLTDTFNKVLRIQEENCGEITRSDVMEGLYAVIKVDDPNFTFDPAAHEVKDAKVCKIVKSVVKKEFCKYLSENPAIAKELSGKVRTAAKARKAVEAARRMIGR